MEMLLERSEYVVSKLSSLLVDYFDGKVINNINTTVKQIVSNNYIETKANGTNSIQLSFDF